MKALAVLVLVSIALRAQEQAQARQKASDQALELGVAAYKTGKYAEAAKFFQKVVDLNPQALESRLYLGIAYTAQYVPGLDTPQNVEFANRAEAQFQRILAVDDRDENAIAWLASLKFMQAQTTPEGAKKEAALDEAAKWYRKKVEVNPDDPDAHYTLGVIAWNKWLPHDREIRLKLGMKPEDAGPLKDDRARRELDAQYRNMIEDGISHLRIAVAINPEHIDAMTHLNLLLRARAELAATKEASDADIKESDQWGLKAVETQKRQAERLRTLKPQL